MKEIEKTPKKIKKNSNSPENSLEQSPNSNISNNLSELDSHLDNDQLEKELERLENTQKESKKKPRFCTLKKAIITIIILIILLLLLKYWKKHAKNILDMVKKSIEKLIAYKYPMNYIILTAIYVTYITICAPGMSILTIVFAFEIKSFWIPYILLMIAHFFSASIIYFFVKICCRNCLKNKFKGNLFYLFVVSQSKKNPWTVSFMVRWISIQPAIKNAFVSLGNVPFYIYILTLYPNSAFHGFIFCYIGIHLRYIDEIFLPKNWKKMSFKKKTSVVLSYFTVLITISIVVFIYCYTNVQMKEFRRRYERKILRKKRVILKRLKTQNDFEIAIKQADLILKEENLETEERCFNKNDEEEGQMSTTINNEEEKSDEKNKVFLKISKEKLQKSDEEKKNISISKEKNIEKLNKNKPKKSKTPKEESMNNLETIKEERASQEISRYSGSKALCFNSIQAESQKFVFLKEKGGEVEEKCSMEGFEGIEAEECRNPVRPTIPSKTLNSLSSGKKRKVSGSRESSVCYPA